ncbi:MAG TPA: SRPBCC family protein [Thermoanaerobaculia bacterium]|nr:SRPBCC family protein [Thermoanaerobaculia bacterium]
MRNVGQLTVSTPTDREIVMTRVFDAPRELVFEAMTRPELLQRWLLGPEGWKMPVCEIDLREGGAYRYVWEKGETRMGMGGVFKEIAAPERIVQTEVFDDAWYPGEALNTTLLVEENGRTTMTLTVLYQSKEARDGVLASPMEEGVAASYDRLAELLASRVAA